MLTIRKSEDRGHAQHGWLDARHTFSFSEYYDPAHMGFRSLRVINQDRIAPGGGFPPHSHRDMEIITYVLKGRVAHQDSMGQAAQIKPGEIQVMTAGTGVVHSEFNPSTQEPLELLQIWIQPRKSGYQPAYGQTRIDWHANELCLLAAPDAQNGVLPINQDARVYAARLDKGRQVQHTLDSGRHVWIQLISGSLTVNGEVLKPGDGLAVSDERALAIEAQAAAEFLLFDLN